MKDKPLGFQMWIIITCFVSIISIIIAIITSFTINNFFADETYRVIQSQQKKSIRDIESKNGYDKSIFTELRVVLKEFETVNNIIVSEDELSNIQDKTTSHILFSICEEALSQKDVMHRYSYIKGEKKLLYSINKCKFKNKRAYLISYIWDTKQRKLTNELFNKIVKMIIMVIIVNITIAKIITNRITAPLRYLEKVFRKIANKEWTEPIHLNRSDEIGKLAISINSMQESLRAKDHEEQVFIQTISHDLKTPIMVIRSYSQAIIDGIYLNNSLEDTALVIGKEALKLEKKVKKLLYLNSLDYIREKKKQLYSINLKNIIEDILNRLSFQQKNIAIAINLEDVYIMGDDEELTIAFENILENYIRYAKSTVCIYSEIVSSKTDFPICEKIKLIFENDGPAIDDYVLENLFHRFYKGKDGHFGLGLSITQNIIEFHSGNISMENTIEGVKCTITLSL